MNVIIILVPLIGTVFGIMHFYDSKEFTQLLLAQPLKRLDIFLGQYLSLCASLSLSLIVGLGGPFLIYGLQNSTKVFEFIFLLMDGVVLTFIFVGISFLIAILNQDKIKGFSYAIFTWLFFSVIYDAILFTSLLIFQEYPLDIYALIATAFNPIDLSRIVLLLRLDISALMGYTGAVFQNFFGTNLGIITSGIVLFIWVASPLTIFLRIMKRKDF
jgi:Cu-processing system permease protein